MKKDEINDILLNSENPGKEMEKQFKRNDTMWVLVVFLLAGLWIGTMQVEKTNATEIIDLKDSLIDAQHTMIELQKSQIDTLQRYNDMQLKIRR